jgi:CYTH domain-containing protein
MTNEIERKFLIDQLPDELVLSAPTTLRQGYVALDGDVEVRVRITATQAWLTVKAGAGLVRTEVEVPVSSTRRRHCGPPPGTGTLRSSAPRSSWAATPLTWIATAD